MPTSRSRSRAWLAGVSILVTGLVAGLAWYLQGGDGSATGPLERDTALQGERLDRSAAIAEADLAISALRADLANERSRERLDPRVDGIAGRLERALAGTDDDVQERREDLLDDLELLRDQVRQGDPAASDTAASISQALRSLLP